MTWIEKGRKEHPGVADEYIMQTYCPEDKEKSMLCFGNDEEECRACWLRPVPEEDGRPMVAPTTGTEPVGAGTARPENAAGQDDDITVAGPIYDPETEEGLTAEGPDRAVAFGNS